ncbi:MAG: gamma-glutamyl-gamma-aminobutyrate hydrolase family protein [Anaerolineae bacterium]|nr:gamma-glutamyl-gamma-aminobutyrate hydrolase family protein [Anaerolineae bacterium]
MSADRVPVIGLTSGTIPSDEQHRPPRVGQNQTYVQALLRAGAAPLLIPNLADRHLLRAVYERLHGLLLTGGGDVDPVHYGEVAHEKCGIPSPERDETEMALVRWAVDEGKPLLAICRGIQVLNVALGGSLYQDIEAQVPGAGRHDWYPGHPRTLRAHRVACLAGSRLADFMASRSLEVNTLHHQAIKEPAPALEITGTAPDGIAEAVEVAGHPFALGVQWHPEELAEEDIRAQGLFNALAEASKL